MNLIFTWSKSQFNSYYYGYFTKILNIKYFVKLQHWVVFFFNPFLIIFFCSIVKTKVETAKLLLIKKTSKMTQTIFKKLIINNIFDPSSSLRMKLEMYTWNVIMVISATSVRKILKLIPLWLLIILIAIMVITLDVKLARRSSSTKRALISTWKTETAKLLLWLKNLPLLVERVPAGFYDPDSERNYLLPHAKNWSCLKLSQFHRIKRTSFPEFGLYFWITDIMDYKRSLPKPLLRSLAAF